MFDDHLVKNRALLDYKKGLFCQVAILECTKGGTQWILSKIKKLLFGLVLEEIRQEIMFDDHLVKNQALLDYKKDLLGEVAILEFFQRGDPMNLVQN